MKKIFLILLINAMSAHISSSQTLIQQIENAYNVLDTVSYIEDIILSFRKGVERNRVRADSMKLAFYGFDYVSMSSTQRKNILDSLNNNSIHSKEVKTLSDTEWINQFSDKVKASTPVYVLNLVPKDRQTLQVDTGKLIFNLFYLDKRFKPEYYVLVSDGRFSDQSTFYPTFSRVVAKNAPKVLRKIMRKQPKYLLYCTGLEGVNTFLYVLNDKIYIYRVAQMEEYELSDYFKHFPR